MLLLGKSDCESASHCGLNLHPLMTADSIPWWLSGKESACSAGDARDPGLIPELEDPLEEEMAICSSILAWRIPWTEEPGRLQSMGLPRESDVKQQHSCRQGPCFTWFGQVYIFLAEISLQSFCLIGLNDPYCFFLHSSY